MKTISTGATARPPAQPENGAEQAARARALLDSVSSLVADDMAEVNRCIEQRLVSDIALIRTLGGYIVHSGGKRLRPLILLLSARACGYEGDDHVKLAAVIEFIHTATLLHDDVVDDSGLRRGKATANEVWGNEASVLVGDFLYTRAFEMMVEVGDMRILEIMAGTTNAIAEGEVMQLLNVHSAETDEVAYLETIRRKTAKLFEAASLLGGVISGLDETACRDLARYGIHLGTAFQLVDDILDYKADSAETGKNVGDDLAEGKPTLPLIQAMLTGDRHQANLIREAIETGEREKLAEIVAIVESTGALAYTSRRAKDQSEKASQAISGLPDSPYKKALADLAEFSILRSY